MCKPSFGRKKECEDVVYEFITNAIDADPNSKPTVVTEDEVVITDEGKGLTIGDFRCGSDKSTSKIGQHGIGLKEAVATCVRNAGKGWGLSIQSKGKLYKFKQVVDSDGQPDICGYIEKDETRPNGTKITLTLPTESMNRIGNVKDRFLLLMPQARKIEHLSRNGIHVYDAPESVKGGIFLRGVRVKAPVDLDKIYNFLEPTEHQKDSINSRHELRTKTFGKYFRSHIQACNPNDSGLVVPHSAPIFKAVYHAPPPPVAVAPPVARSVPVYSSQLPPRVPSAGQDPIQFALANTVARNFGTVDYPMWTLTPDERETCRAARSKIQERLRQVDGVSIGAINEQGSFPKNTVIPGFLDGDMVLTINEPVPSRDDFISRVNNNDFTFFPSGNEILTCKFEGMEFDLVLKGPGHNRFSDTVESISAVVKRLPESDRARVCSYIRACKYWVKRQNGKFPVKSFVVEQIIIALFETGVSVTFQSFLAFFFFGRWATLPENCRDCCSALDKQTLEAEAGKALVYCG